jgi:proteasome lid subunit RPN8/RPN11
MSIEAVLELPRTVYPELHRHLVRNPGGNEEAAFVFAQHSATDNRFTYVEWAPVPPEGFVVQLPYHFELTDETRRRTIKRAHDLGCSVIEVHSHTGPWPAQFSPSDWSGFEETVPHFWWRLKARPYAALVVTKDGFDGFAWLVDPNAPTRLAGIAIGNQLLEPTRLSPLERDGYDWKI